MARRQQSGILAEVARNNRNRAQNRTNRAQRTDDPAERERLMSGAADATTTAQNARNAAVAARRREIAARGGVANRRGHPGRGQQLRTGGSPSGSPAADAVTSTSSGGGTTGGTSTGSSTTGTSRASIPSGPSTPPKKAGTAKPKKGTLLHKALKNKNRMRFNEFDKKDRNRSVAFLEKNYEWARKKGNEDRVEKVASHLMGRPGSALGTGKPNSIGVKAKGQSRKPPKGVSDKEFKKEIARYKATHKAARDPEKAKNVEAIVATILRGRQKTKKKPTPVGGPDAPPNTAAQSPANSTGSTTVGNSTQTGAGPGNTGTIGGSSDPRRLQRPAVSRGPVDPDRVRRAIGGGPDRPQPPRPNPPLRGMGGPDRPPKKRRPKPGSGPKRSHG